MPRGASVMARNVKRRRSGEFSELSKSARKKNKVSKRNQNREWTNEDTRELKQLIRENTPTRVIGLKLGRPIYTIRYRARKEGISLSPTNRSPYGPRKMSAAAKLAARRNLEKARKSHGGARLRA